MQLILKNSVKCTICVKYVWNRSNLFSIQHCVKHIQYESNLQSTPEVNQNCILTLNQCETTLKSWHVKIGIVASFIFSTSLDCTLGSFPHHSNYLHLLVVFLQSTGFLFWFCNFLGGHSPCKLVSDAFDAFAFSPTS